MKLEVKRIATELHTIAEDIEKGEWINKPSKINKMYNKTIHSTIERVYNKPFYAGLHEWLSNDEKAVEIIQSTPELQNYTPPPEILLALKDDYYIPHNKWNNFVKMVHLSDKCTLHHMRIAKSQLNDCQPTTATPGGKRYQYDLLSYIQSLISMDPPKDPTQPITLKFCFDGCTMTAKSKTQLEVAAFNLLYSDSTEVTDNDPHADNLKPKDIVPTSEKGKKTAHILNEFYKQSLRILKDAPLNVKRRSNGIKEANAILYRGGGEVPSLPNFNEKYSLDGGFIAGVALVSGICKLVGLKDFTPEGVTGSIDTDVKKKFAAAVEALKEVDFVLVNVKGTDIAGHDGNGIAKKEFIEKIDAALKDTVIKVRNEIVLCFTGDHSTPASAKEHTSDPVPILLRYPGCRKDGVGEFDEIKAKDGYLRLQGSDLMNVLLSSSNRAEKYGA